uniref:Uncharacterized protein n=1 Tax=Arundo donax TaxID=35708 RepID=A0A0A9G8W4_ARUDO
MILGGSGFLTRVEAFQFSEVLLPKVALDCDRDAAPGCVTDRRCTGSAVAVIHS